MSPSQPLEQRFLAKVQKTDNCWFWIGARKRSGYGYMVIGGRKALKHARAHRISYEIAYGPIPAGFQVLHHCDRPNCVNPAHLFLGTHTDNMRDRNIKERFSSKLSACDVRNIRKESAKGDITQADLARFFGVRRGQISRIIGGSRWEHTLGLGAVRVAISSQ